MFGRLQVPASREYEALLVPDSAIGSEQIRRFVFVVGPDDKVMQKFVTPGALHGKLRVVTGLDEHDRVIVNGLMRARPGVKVTPLTEEQMKQMQQQQAGKPGQKPAGAPAGGGEQKRLDEKPVPESGSKASEKEPTAPADQKPAAAPEKKPDASPEKK
jgi:hypothetical protein